MEKTMKYQQGFTLVEIMVVVIIVAILSAVAIPFYQDYTIRAKIPDATSALANDRVQMEQFFQDHRTYTGAPVCAGNISTPNGYFTISCPILTATAYTIQATGNGPMAGFSYTIDQNNNKTSSVVAPARQGWIGASATCWITKVGSQC
jgi:type IV pilus assembly protein PilE